MTPTAPPPRLLVRLRQAAQARGDPVSAVEVLVGWVRAFILFHNKCHPETLDRGHVAHFLEHVVQTEPLPALAMARSALDLL